MTLPSLVIFPIHNDQILSGDPKEMDRYIRELVTTMTDSYSTLAQAINGKTRNSFGAEETLWTPVLKDTLNDNTTFTYAADSQVGWVLRQGALVDCWFDLTWTAATGAITGDMYLELPYQVALTDGRPFVGVVQPSTIVYTGGTECVINAISNTFRGEIWNCGSAFTSARQASLAAGRMTGHIRYIGKQSERQD